MRYLFSRLGGATRGVPVADEAGHKRVQRSADEEGACHRRRCRVPQTDEKIEDQCKPDDLFGYRNRKLSSCRNRRI